MNAEIIAVGSELLLGQIQNSNATYLSSELSKMGINVYHHVVVGDNSERLYEIVQSGLNRSDLLIFTGGLGPTKDDLTKETVAKVTNTDLIYDDETEKRINKFFIKRKRTMTMNNRKQALILEGAKVLPNDHGLACGMVLETGDKKIMMLPGPPNELIPMFEQYAIPYLQGKLYKKEHIQSKVLRFFEIGESQLVDKIDDLIEAQSNPTIAPLASSGGEVTLRLTVKGENKQKNDEKLVMLKKQILDRLENYYVSDGEEAIEQLFVKQLKKRKMTIAAAESITGGKFSADLTGISGISSVFRGSIICYSNSVKESELSIPHDVLIKDGPVSGRCAELLASHVRTKLASDIGISFTGVAGPESLDGNEPGLVYVGIASKEKVTSYCLHLAGSRENIRERSVKYGFYYLFKCLS